VTELKKAHCFDHLKTALGQNYIQNSGRKAQKNKKKEGNSQKKRA
jgi:hypothetical protein